MEQSKNSSKTDDTSVKQIINEYKGKLFKENIRSILQYNYGFKKLDISPKIFKKKIEYDNKIISEILQNEETTVNIMNKSFIFLFDNKFNVQIYSEVKELLKTINSKFSNEDKTCQIKNTGLTIKLLAYTEMEIDGFFKIHNFSKNLFNNNEISIIYSNIINEKEENFEWSIIEAKLSPKKSNELITQIKKEK